jgi:type I restriction enzyme S subunit
MTTENGRELPPGWATARIEDLFEPLEDGRTLHQGWSPQCEKYPSENEEIWGVLKTTSIQGGTFLPEHNKCLPVHLPPRPIIEVKEGDILITCAGPRARCGVACLVRNTRRRLMISGKMYRFRVPEQHIDARFIEAYLQTARAWDAIDSMKTGGSDSGLNLTHDRFRLLKVPVAPLNEQRRIVKVYEELVSDIDAGVAALERVRANLKHYRASILKAAVEGTLTAEWRHQQPQIEPAVELLKRILGERRHRWEEEQLRKFAEAGKEPPKNWKAKYIEPVALDASKLPPLPEGWCWTIAEALFSSIRSGSSAVPQDEKTHYPILRSSSVRPMKIDFSDVRYLSKESSKAETNYLCEHDLLFTRLSGNLEYVGNCVAIPKLHDLRIQYPDRLFCAKLVETKQAAYVSLYFSSAFARKKIEAMAKSTAGHQRISIGGITEQPIALPPLPEQERIAAEVEDQLSVVEHVELDVEAKLKAARALRQSILRYAFTGQLTSQDPNDDPASELLKRIAAEREGRQQQAISSKRSTVKTKQPRKRTAAR